MGHRTTASGGTELLGLDPHRYITSDRKDEKTSFVTIIKIVIKSWSSMSVVYMKL